MNFFTADPHFNHGNIIRHCSRPFQNVEEMNSTMIMNWNSRVRPGDVIYVIGDFVWEGFGVIIPQLVGEIHLIPGGHDERLLQFLKRNPGQSNRDWQERLIIHPPILEKSFPIGGQNEKVRIIMCHYSMRVWSASHYNSWHLYGHSHGRLAGQGKSFDIGVDANNFFPLSFVEVADIMSQRPDNFNLVHR